MRLLVVGGTGLVGSAVVKALRVRGHTVRVVVRRPPGASPDRVEGAEYIAGDVTVAESLRGAAEGCAAVVHVAGIARERRPRASYQAVNVDGTRHVLAEAQRAGVPFVVYVSSLGAERGRSAYHRSKRHAEMLVREYPGRWLVLRPGNVYGRGDGMIAMYLQMLRMLPITPGVGNVDQPFQPVCADDLGEVVSRAVERRDLAGQTMEIAGTETTTQRELHAQLCALIDRHPPLVVMPAWLVRFGIRLLGLLRIDAPIGPDQVVMMQEGNVLLDQKRSAMRDVFGVEPMPLSEGLHLLSRATPEQMPGEGQGKLVRRRWWADIEGSDHSPASLLNVVRREFTTLMPHTLIDVGSEPASDEQLVTGALISLALPVRGHVQVRVEEVTPHSVVCVTLRGHPLSGVVRLLCEARGDRLRFEVQTVDHPSGRFDRLLMLLFGVHLKRITWHALVLAVAERSGGRVANGVEHDSESLDGTKGAHVQRWVRGLIRRRPPSRAPGRGRADWSMRMS
ncbi:MAG TPA: NAD-dependent epimerase/dehydratase family protein [Gemmatimonas sp.]|nr:NAD-dependent epimerase/dehydratase family protein [Gemmatimonas sp.]